MDINKKYDDMIKAAELMEKDELTDDELNELSSKITSLNEEEQMEDYTPTEEDLALEQEPQELTVSIDPYTGKINNVLNTDTNPNKEVSSLENLLEMDFDDVRTNLNISENIVKESIASMFPHFQVSDMQDFMVALNRYRKGDKVSYYNLLPQSMKTEIDTLVGGANIGYASQKEARKYVVEGMFEQIISENYSNAITVDLTDSLNESYNQLYEDTKGEFSKYNNNQRYMYETHMLEYAEKIREEDPEKADLCIRSSEAFVEAYTYQKMYFTFTNSGKLKAKKIELEKFERTCADWCMKYNNTKMVINNLYDLYPILSVLTDGVFDDEIVKRFIIAFTKYTLNMSPEKVDEHVFMYYFIKNILSLKYHNVDDEKEKEFYDKVKDNVFAFLTLIREKTTTN